MVTSCIKIDTLSKLTYTDGVKFDGILKDVFPEAEIEENIERDLIKKIEETFVEMGLPINQRQVILLFYFCEYGQSYWKLYNVLMNLRNSTNNY